MSGWDTPPPCAGPRICQECGEQLAPQAAFCRACGTKYVESPAEQVTAVVETADACPRCGATLAPGAAFCRSCGAPVAVEDGPTTEPQPTPSPRPIPPTPAPLVAAAPAPAPRRPSPNRVPILITVVLILIGAGIAAVLLTKGSSSGETVAVTETFPEPAPEAGFKGQPEGSDGAIAEAEEHERQVEEEELAEQESVEAEEEAAAEAEATEQVTATGVPAVPRPQMNEEVSALLESYHEDVVDEDFQGAWAMLSPRKRRQYLREYGYHKWASAQASLSTYLHPAGLRAEVISLEGEGVARVDVTGMKWDQPGAPCTEWSGFTWVKYEGGEWTYDPGYSTTPARQAEWKPKSSRLLGGDCT